ncbi:MAG TPA: hypothetical protein VKS01_09440, partial [Bryobacteraceae bacterium]|nr:hypothetical protein [Bryobacteraceae bacterium]
GNWSADSIASLKRFQQDQNLTADGKIGALSLIALGLGPRRVQLDATATAPPQAPPPVPQPQNQQIPPR